MPDCRCIWSNPNAPHVHVAPWGADTNAGTWEWPFKTIQYAIRFLPKEKQR